MDSRVILHEAHKDMLCASNILIQENCFPTRVVLYKRPGKFVVHTEILEGASPPALDLVANPENLETYDTTGTGCKFKHRAYDQGNYFDFKHAGVLHLPEENAMLKAGLECFHQRSLRMFGWPAHSLTSDQMGNLEGIRDRLYDLVERGEEVDVGSLLYSLNHIIVNNLNGQEHKREIDGKRAMARVAID